MKQDEMMERMLMCKHAAFLGLVEQRLEAVGYDLYAISISHLTMLIPTTVLFEATDADLGDADGVLSAFETLDDTIIGVVNAMRAVL